MLFIKRYCYNFHNINTIINKNFKGKTVKVRGWIQNVRRLKNHIFLDINDGSTAQKFQIVIDKSDETKTLSIGDVIKATGQIHIAPHGHYELKAGQVESIAKGHLNEGYPFIPKQVHPMEYVRDYLHLRSRFNNTAAIIRLRHRAQKILHDVMDEHNFIHINTPIITTNDCEGAGEVFTVQPDSKNLLKQMSRPDMPLEHSYFDSKVYLSVSGQLHLEAMSYGLGNTYTLSPVFRAENCKSPLHLSEFYMFEAEVVYMETIDELCSFIQNILKEITTRLLSSNDIDIKYCQKQMSKENSDFKWLELSWPLVKYKDAMDIVVKNRDKLKTDITPDRGFSKEQELFLIEYFKTPLFIIEWPTAQKPFYMKVSREDPTVVHALDLIMPTVGELCGGSLREFNEQYLINRTKLPQNLEWYLELRKFGGVPTGGFGMGFERYLQLLTGVKNIRDVIPFPRYPHSCKM